MNLAIKTLEVSHFKGIAHLLLEIDGKSAVISGRNGTGKTSICDAFLWLLFGKDSAGNKPDVKPRNSLGERVEGLESDVRAMLSADGKDITLRRQWHEVWSKDAEGGAKVYSRDETLCWINEVPVKLDKDYTPYVLSMVGGDEGTFKLLTDLGAFMRLHWSERRRELLNIVGSDPDAELRAKPEFNTIGDILRDASPEDAKKRLLEQRKALEVALKTIPARIDELKRTMQPVTGAEVDAAKAAIGKLVAELDDIDALLTPSPETLKKANDLYARKRELETRRAGIEADLRKPIREAITAAEDKLGSLRRTAAKLSSDALLAEDDLRRHHITLALLKDQRTEKLNQYHRYESLTYVPPVIGTTCPTCGQELPEERIHETGQKHQETWDKERLASMQTIKDEGMKLAERITTATQQIADLTASAAVIQAQVAALPDLVALETEINALRATHPKAEDNPDWKAVTADIAAMDDEIAGQGTNDRRAELEQRKATVTAKLQPHKLVLAQQELTANVQARIDVLQGNKRDVGIQIAHIEGDIDMLAKYVRARCGMLEESINRLFHTIRWKLFDFAKNGSLIDCCDATVNGIAYGLSALNTGACVNADIEIINVLSKAYGVNVPCFVDNAERVNQIGFPGGQRILLRVTEDAELTIMKED